jgi:mercuric ion binding protein
MKVRTLFFLSLFSFNSLAGELQVKVNGMVCSLCAQGIEKKFKSLPEVKTVKVNLDQKLVNLETQEGKELTDQQVTKIIQEAGYNVAKIERK